MWISSAESHLSLLEGIIRSAKRLRKGKPCCLEHRRKVYLCLLYKIHYTVDHPKHKYLHHFVAARNTRVSAALGKLALVIPRCRTYQFSQSFLPAAVPL